MTLAKYKKQKDVIVSSYIRGKLNISECRKALDHLEGKTMVELLDNK